ncbi:MAG: polymer-forming cytoskeletal protein [Lawsonibacter sp.]|nr:polymer-forming cytoskeletal protein [Lawsonibacter sp.]
MGLFGAQPKQEFREEPRTAMEEETASQPFDGLPKLPKPQTNTVIAKGVTLTGALEGEGTVQIEGALEGEIRLKGSVVVAATGLIQGPITADLVRIAGQVKGEITARSHLRLEQTGSIQGDISTASLVVEDGGAFNGRSTMLQPPAPEEVPLEVPHRDGEDSLLFGPNYQLDGEEELL